MLLEILKAFFALAVTLGLIGAVAYAIRRWAPAGMLQLRPQADRRLQVVESLTLDAQRRLILVRLDKQERLILLGEGRLLQTTDTVSQPVSS